MLTTSSENGKRCVSCKNSYAKLCHQLSSFKCFSFVTAWLQFCNWSSASMKERTCLCVCAGFWVCKSKYDKILQTLLVVLWMVSPFKSKTPNKIRYILGFVCKKKAFWENCSEHVWVSVSLFNNLTSLQAGQVPADWGMFWWTPLMGVRVLI